MVVPLCMFDIQATTKSKYYDHIVLLYLESRRCRYRSIIFVCFNLYVSVFSLIDYLDTDKIVIKVHKPFVMLIYMIVCTGVSP